MACLAEVYDRVEKLVNEGMLYYGQPTPNMEAVLKRESAKWRIGKRAWGEGYNEDIECMLSAARELIYETDISTEELQELGRPWLECALLIPMERSPGSPYYVRKKEIAWYLRGCEEASIEPFDMKCDPKFWCLAIEDFTALRLSGVPLKKAARAGTFMEWFWRAIHKLNKPIWAWEDRISFTKRIAESSAPFSRLRVIGMCAIIFTPNWEEAVKIAREFKNLKEVIDHVGMVKSLVG